MSGYSDALMSKSLRLNLFQDYDAMDSDAIISSALDIYSDESTMKSEYGEGFKNKLQIMTKSKKYYTIYFTIY